MIPATGHNQRPDGDISAEEQEHGAASFRVAVWCDCDLWVRGAGENGSRDNCRDSASTTTTSLADEMKPDGDVTRRPEPLLSQSQLADGWVQLFDGQTLFGWKANSQANWSVRAGAIPADTGPPGLLVTTVPFADYELTCDFR